MTETLREKQTRFAMAVPDLLREAQALGYFVTLGEAWRSPEQAQWNAQHGLGVSNSLHTQRLAIDLNLFTAEGTLITDDTGHKDLGAWWVQQQPDFRWGGNFTTLKDFDHYSLTPDGVTE